MWRIDRNDEIQFDQSLDDARRDEQQLGIVAEYSAHNMSARVSRKHSTRTYTQTK